MEIKPRVCRICGRVEDGVEVKFVPTKMACNKCRHKQSYSHEKTPEVLVTVWGPRNEDKGKRLIKGVDPCKNCLYDPCKYCVAYHVKMAYRDWKTDETKAFIKTFRKNLLDNIRKVV